MLSKETTVRKEVGESDMATQSEPFTGIYTEGAWA